MNTRTKLMAWALRICTSALLACTTSALQVQPLLAAAHTDTSREEYSIHPGDQLDIKFFYHPDMNETVTVRPDGRISLQLVSELVVDGVTARGLSETLTRLYGKQLRMSDATVIVRSFSTQRIYVDGEVGRPGVLTLADNMDVLQAIAEAGGVKETGRMKDLVIVRRTDDGAISVLRADAAYAKATDTSALRLRPFDVVYVPRSRIGNVNRWVDQYIRKNIPITFGILSNALLP